MIQLRNGAVQLVIQVPQCEFVTASKVLAEIARKRKCAALHAVLQRAHCQGSNSQSRILGICHTYLQNGLIKAAPQDEEISLQCYRQKDCRYAPAQTKLKAPRKHRAAHTRMHANTRSNANSLRPPTHSMNQHSIYL